MSKVSDRERESARETLRDILKPGMTVYTVLRHVSRSGMSRQIDVIHMQDGSPRWLSRLVSKAVGIPFSEKKESLTVGGCGMDMGFHVVYELSSALYGQGFECIGEGCRANDHSNGDRDYSPHMHRDGGYALSQRWI